MAAPRFGKHANVIRILARPPQRLTTRRAKALIEDALQATTWGRQAPHRATQFAADAAGAAAHDQLFEVAVRNKVGSARYASRAHDLVQRLYDTGAFQRVEADVPVDAYQRASVPGGPRAQRGANDCAANAAARPHDWALREVRVDAALKLLPAAAAGGGGILVGHPDSGYSDHFALGMAKLDLAHDRDVIHGDDDAIDPLRPPRKSVFNLLPNSGHGTSTASVIVGTGDDHGFEGVASGATLVPIRATESVIQVFDTDVAKAVRWARQVRCHVISMSLGGKGLFGLQDAIQEAIDAGLIVMAAAGNRVGIVTAPASYDNCIAVAATLPGCKPWPGSSRGAAVDVAAPGGCVWCALFDWKATPPGRVVRQSNGTSYAVAHVAGVAALWLSFHGHDALAAKYGLNHIQAAFVHVLRQPGVCRRPPGWDSSQWGVGVVNAEAVLKHALPEPYELGGIRALARGGPDEPLERLAAVADRTPTEVARWVDRILGPGSSADRGTLRRFEGELAYHLVTADLAPPAATRRARRSARPTAIPVPELRGASPQLLARQR